MTRAGKPNFWPWPQPDGEVALLEIGRGDLGDPGAVIAVVAARTLYRPDPLAQARDRLGRQRWSRRHGTGYGLALLMGAMALDLGQRQPFLAQPQVAFRHARADFGAAVE